MKKFFKVLCFIAVVFLFLSSVSGGEKDEEVKEGLTIKVLGREVFHMRMGLAIGDRDKEVFSLRT